MIGIDHQADMLAHDVAGTSGETLELIRANETAMAFLDTMMTDTGFSLGDHVRCCKTELDVYYEYIREHGK